MFQGRISHQDARPAEYRRAFDADLVFLRRWAGPLGLLARAMLAYVFIVEGVGKISAYAGAAGYMQSNGVDPRLLPLAILTELGGGILVLVGLKTRWAAIALSGFCVLAALLFHFGRGADEMIGFQKDVAIAGGFLLLAVFGAGSWSIDGWRGRQGELRRSASRSVNTAGHSS